MCHELSSSLQIRHGGNLTGVSAPALGDAVLGSVVAPSPSASVLAHRPLPFPILVGGPYWIPSAHQTWIGLGGVIVSGLCMHLAPLVVPCYIPLHLDTSHVVWHKSERCMSYVLLDL